MFKRGTGSCASRSTPAQIPAREPAPGAAARPQRERAAREGKRRRVESSSGQGFAARTARARRLRLGRRRRHRRSRLIGQLRENEISRCDLRHELQRGGPHRDPHPLPLHRGRIAHRPRRNKVTVSRRGACEHGAPRPWPSRRRRRAPRRGPSRDGAATRPCSPSSPRRRRRWVTPPWRRNRSR